MDHPEEMSSPVRDAANKNAAGVSPVIRGAFSVFEVLALTVALVLLLNAFVFRFSVVSGDSMNNTLFDGDRLIISDAFYTPARGDIIVFQSKDPDFHTDSYRRLVKRVIAVGGDRVAIYNDVVYVNGQALDEPYAFHDFPSTPYMAERTVSPGCVFVLGDNRAHSEDSRRFVEEVDARLIIGKVLFRISPSFGSVYD